MVCRLVWFFLIRQTNFVPFLLLPTCAFAILIHVVGRGGTGMFAQQHAQFEVYVKLKYLQTVCFQSKCIRQLEVNQDDGHDEDSDHNTDNNGDDHLCRVW